MENQIAILPVFRGPLDWIQPAGYNATGFRCCATCAAI